MKKWIIAPGNASKELANRLGNELGTNILDIETKLFHDGESKITIQGNVNNKNVILLQSTYPPTDRHILQLIFMAHNLNKNGANVYAVIPYLAYSRQDKMFLEGETVSLSVLSKMLEMVNIKKMITIDIHNEKSLDYFNFPTVNLSAVSIIAQYFKDKIKINNTFAVSPDFGSSNRVKEFAKYLDIDHIIMKKSRDKKTGKVTIDSISKKIDGNDIIFIDDMISTGTSISQATIELKKNGVNNVYASCTHPLLVNNAIDNLRNSEVDEIIGTNTIPTSVSKIDITSIISSYFSSIS